VSFAPRPSFKVASQFGGEKVNTDQRQVSKPQSGTAGPAGSDIRSAARGENDPDLAPGPLYAMVALCRMHRLPEPTPEFQFHDTRRWRFDYAWPMRMVALEVEGGIWTEGRHTRGAGFLADNEKYSEAAIAGWRVIYCTPGDLSTLGLERVRRAVG
jgi:hypothetical protein